MLLWCEAVDGALHWRSKHVFLKKCRCSPSPHVNFMMPFAACYGSVPHLSDEKSAFHAFNRLHFWGEMTKSNISVISVHCQKVL